MAFPPEFLDELRQRLSLPEMERHVQPCGAIGAYLHRLYIDNPLRDFAGLDERAPGFSWVIWDIINIAWLLNPDWVPSTLRPTPALDAERRWVARSDSAPPLREGYAVARNAIFGDFFEALAKAAS